MGNVGAGFLTISGTKKEKDFWFRCIDLCAAQCSLIGVRHLSSRQGVFDIPDSIFRAVFH